MTENAIAEDYELPGADLSNEDASVTVIPMQGRRVHLLRMLPGEASQPACLHYRRRTAGMQGVCGLMAFDEAYNEPENVEVLVKSLDPGSRLSCITPMPETPVPICAPPKK